MLNCMASVSAVSTEMKSFFNSYMEDKLKKFFPLFQKYSVDSYLYSKVTDKKGASDLYKIWFTALMSIGMAMFMMFAIFS